MIAGLCAALLSAVVATYLASLQHFVGAPMLGLFLGILISNSLPASAAAKMKPGMAFSTKYLLKTGIILAGGTMSFSSIMGVGFSAIPLIVFNICLAFLVAYFIGKVMKVSVNTRTLVGGGTAICGGTAIATLSPIIDAEEHETAYAMTAIFLFDIFAAIMWPYAARALGLSAQQYGILGGLAISDTASVTAAGATFDMLMGNAAVAMPSGEQLTAGSMAVIVKLTRTVMLIFVAIATMIVTAARKGGEKTSLSGSGVKRILKSFPVFIIGFIVMALLNTIFSFSSIGVAGTSIGKLLSNGYKFLITTALVGIGYKIKLKDLFTKGARPVLLGGFTWLALAVSTLICVLVVY